MKHWIVDMGVVRAQDDGSSPERYRAGQWIPFTGDMFRVMEEGTACDEAAATRRAQTLEALQQQRMRQARPGPAG